jgi:hypothetical protein
MLMTDCFNKCIIILDFFFASINSLFGHDLTAKEGFLQMDTRCMMKCLNRLFFFSLISNLGKNSITLSFLTGKNL